MPIPITNVAGRLVIGLIAVALFWLIVWIVRQVTIVSRNSADRTHKASSRHCAPIPDRVYRRPDPLLYSQAYLMAQGLAVTWDNPDIHLELGGIPVSSENLTPNTEYEIVARIWNGSNEAPAVDLPIRFSYLDFGIGTVNVPIGQLGDTRVDLPVRGASGLPVLARHRWRTPSTPGHYCIQVEPIWSDDANPANNLGQENVFVKPLNSPNAMFQFPVRNGAGWRRHMRLEADTYQLPPAPDCRERAPGRVPELSEDEQERGRREIESRHGRGRFAIPPGWQVVIQPPELILEPGEQQMVTVAVTAPDGFTGQKVFNVNAYDGQLPIGGVTLRVHS